MRLATVFGVRVDDLFHWVDADAARARYARGDKENGLKVLGRWKRIVARIALGILVFVLVGAGPRLQGL